MKSVGVANRDFTRCVINRRQRHVEPFVTEDSDVIDVCVVVRGIVVSGLLKLIVRQSGLDIGLGQSLIFLVRMNQHAGVCPGLKILAGPDAMCAAERSPGLERGDKGASLTVVAQIRFVRRWQFGNIEFLPVDAVGADDWLTAESSQEALESPLRVGVVRVVNDVLHRIGGPRRVRLDGDEVVFQRFLKLPLTQDGLGPLQPVHTLGICGAGHTCDGRGCDHPQLVSLCCFVPGGRTASLQSFFPRLIRLNDGPALLRLMHRPLETVDFRDAVIVQKQLPLTDRSRHGLLGGCRPLCRFDRRTVRPADSKHGTACRDGTKKFSS